MDLYKLVGKPNWNADTEVCGLDISSVTKELLLQKYGGCLFWKYFSEKLRDEPALFLRLDLQDFSPDIAKFLKAFLEHSAWPKVQKKVAVLICSLEERIKYCNVLDNCCCSGVKWQERTIGKATA